MIYKTLPFRQDFGGLNPSHHLLLCNEMVDSLKKPEKALHVPAPLIQDVVSIARFGEADDVCGTIDFRIDGLGCNKLADVLFRLIFSEVEQLRQARHLNTRVVFRYHTDIVFNDPLPEVLPPLIRFWIIRLFRLGVKNVGGAEVGSKLLGDHRPPHDLMECKEP